MPCCAVEGVHVQELVGQIPGNHGFGGCDVGGQVIGLCLSCFGLKDINVGVGVLVRLPETVFKLLRQGAKVVGQALQACIRPLQNRFALRMNTPVPFRQLLHLPAIVARHVMGHPGQVVVDLHGLIGVLFEPPSALHARVYRPGMSGRGGWRSRPFRCCC